MEMNIDIDNLIEKATELVMVYGVKVVMAIVVYIIGKWLAKLISRTLSKTMNARGVDPTVTKFTGNLTYYALFTMVCIAALSQIGVQTASFVAVIGAAGLAIGLALQGSLANFASGVLMIIFRPIKVGDYVEAGGASGTVKEIAIFCTTLLTPDNKTVIISNSAIMDDNIINYSTQTERRIDLVVGVAYDANLDQVQSELKQIVAAEPRILTEKDVTIAVSELADSSVNLVLRPWVKTSDYWPVRFDLTEKIKKRFDEVGIEFPFPQMDVHLNKVESETANG